MGKFEDKKSVKEKGASVSPARTILEYLHDLVYILAAILVVFTFFVRIVVVSGSSMFDTLADGDYLLLVNSPLCGKLEQGDIVVAGMERFKNGEPIVKRVIATEGQLVDIDFSAGKVYVDGIELDEDYIYTLTTIAEGMQFPLVVPEGCLFVMGDNRKLSFDSRSPSIGFIDKREVLGKAVFSMIPGINEETESRDFGRIVVSA